MLTPNDNSCLVNLSPSDDGYRKTILSFNHDGPGTTTRGGALKSLALARPQFGRLHRVPPDRIVTASAERLQISLTMLENPQKPGIKVIGTNQNQKIAIREKGGVLKLTCLSCNKPIYIRAK